MQPGTGSLQLVIMGPAHAGAALISPCVASGGGRGEGKPGGTDLHSVAKRQDLGVWDYVNKRNKFARSARNVPSLVWRVCFLSFFLGESWLDNQPARKTVWRVECSLLPRRPCRFGGARRPRAWCRRRPAALAAPWRAASVTPRALRGVFWHVSACQRRQQARLPCLRPRACGRHARLDDARRAGLRARGPRRASMARRSTGACPACSGHAVQHRQLSGGVYRARAGRLGRDSALNSTTTTSSPIGPPTAGLRSAPLDGRMLSNLSTVSFTSLLSGTGAGRLASPALPTPTTRASARRPRRLRQARGARRSSGACSAGCAEQTDSLRAPLMRRGAAGGTAAHAALWASPSCPRRVADATCRSPLPCTPCHQANTHTHTNTHTLLIIG